VGSTRLLLKGEERPRPIGARPVIIQNLKEKHEHTALTQCHGAKGRQKSESSLYEMGVELGLKIYPE
jgi:hypothetical protein